MASKVSPWMTAWLNPRVTIKNVLKKDTKYSIFFISWVVGFVELVNKAISGYWGEHVPAAAIFLIFFLLALPLGLIIINVRALVITWLVGFSCGEADSKKVIKAVTWSSIPLLIPMFFCILPFLISGEKTFLPLARDENASSITILFGLSLFFFGLSSITAYVWSDVLLIYELAEIQKCSLWKSAVPVLIWFFVSLLFAFLLHF